MERLEVFAAGAARIAAGAFDGALKEKWPPPCAQGPG